MKNFIVCRKVVYIEKVLVKAKDEENAELKAYDDDILEVLDSNHDDPDYEVLGVEKTTIKKKVDVEWVNWTD